MRWDASPCPREPPHYVLNLRGEDGFAIGVAVAAGSRSVAEDLTLNVLDRRTA